VNPLSWPWGSKFHTRDPLPQFSAKVFWTPAMPPVIKATLSLDLAPSSFAIAFTRSSESGPLKAVPPKMQTFSLSPKSLLSRMTASVGVSGS